MVSQSEIDQINKRLRELYGCELDGRAKFRLSWSDSQTEVRVGTYNEFYGTGPGKIFLRQVTGAKEVPKYFIAKQKWVLERLCFFKNHPALLQTSGYEPLWVFRDENNGYLDPEWWAIQKILYCFFCPEPVKSASDLAREELEERQKEEDYNYMVIQNQSPYLATMMHNHEAAFFNAEKQKFWERTKNVRHRNLIGSSSNKDR